MALIEPNIISSDGIDPSDCDGTDNRKFGDIASAYRKACEEDSSLVVREQSFAAPNWKYYIIPAKWMNDFLEEAASCNSNDDTNNSSSSPVSISISLGKEDASDESQSPSYYGIRGDEKKEIESLNNSPEKPFPKSILGEICNSSLLQSENQDQSPSKSHETKVNEKPERELILKSLKHGGDYALVGPSAWRLLSSEYGHDIALARPVIQMAAGQMAVEVYPRNATTNHTSSRLVTLPLSGRWEIAMKVKPYPTYHYNQDDASFTTPVANDLFPDPISDPLKTSQPLLLPPSTTTYNTMEPSRKKTRKMGRCGLGNLGNTCFLNSTLQCLAHTDPLRQYFLSENYRPDLNRNNPLGTGGELATEFAKLLKEMWDAKPTSTSSIYSYDNSTSSVVYPRNFKYVLGKHAEQFIGYDQHDSQEVAIYLLDALHEDTNRVTVKPYVEKPEQKQGETDTEAAAKAWELHLNREDSKVLEGFMGLIKSRVECPLEGCGRVSTTFDPIMYLSVPIPGAQDRVFVVTFVGINKKMKKIQVKLNKSSSIGTLMEKISIEVGGVKKEDLVICDVWNDEIYSYFEGKEEVGRIRDTDQTFAFQLLDKETMRQTEINQMESGKLVEMEDCAISPSDYDFNFHLAEGDKWMEVLEDAVKKKLDQGDTWMNVLRKYLTMQSTKWHALSNPERTTHDEKMVFLAKIHKFVKECANCPENDVVPSSKGNRNEEPPAELLTLQEKSILSPTFVHVETRKDLITLHYCGIKYKEFCQNLRKEKLELAEDINPDGIVINVLLKRDSNTANARTMGNASTQNYNMDKTFATPLVMRIGSKMTVYQFREAIGKRLNRALTTTSTSDLDTFTKVSDDPVDDNLVNDDLFEDMDYTKSSDNRVEGDTHPTPLRGSREDAMLCSINENMETLMMRRISLTYQQKPAYTYSSQSQPRNLGSITKLSPSNTLALPNDEAETKCLSDLVGNHGTINLHFSHEFIEQSFNITDWNAIQEISKPEEGSPKKSKLTVLDCIEKYCQVEQLEESEMWYCDHCKTHVKAWKQFHLYRSPPILIIHLKRFYFSPSTHRRDKIDTLIDFPLDNLDLTQYVMHWNEDEEPIYDCYAVSNHYGGLGGGHYTAYAKNDNQWCHFDDSRVTEGVTESDVVSSAAYVLYYKRRDVKNWEIPTSPVKVEDVANTSMSTSSVTSISTSSLSDPVSPKGSVSYADKVMSCSHSLGNVQQMVVAEEHHDDSSHGIVSRVCASPMNSLDGDMYDADSVGQKVHLYGENNPQDE